MKKAPQSANIALRELFKHAKKLKPKRRLTAAQMDKTIDDEIRTINSKISKKKALRLVRKMRR